MTIANALAKNPGSTRIGLPLNAFECTGLIGAVREVKIMGRESSLCRIRANSVDSGIFPDLAPSIRALDC